MRVLLVSPKADGAWFAWLMRKQGADVEWVLLDDKYEGTFDGILPARKFRPKFSNYDLVVFDSDGHGALADESIQQTPTIGASSLSDRLEEDRLFGLELMEQIGVTVPKWEAFDTPEKGIAWIQKNHARTVFKPIGDVDDKATTYVSKDECDMIAFMERVFQKAKIDSYILQEVVSGTEVAVGGWFNGNEWVLIDHNLEEKKLMPGNIGPNTGCAGSVMWIPSHQTPLFQQTLDKATDAMREMGYVGLIDLNVIVNEGTAFGLEWTPRFGYESTANLTALLNMPFHQFLYDVAMGGPMTLIPSHQFATTIRVSVPPYPDAEKAKKRQVVPVLGIDLDKLELMPLYDVRNVDGQLETTGIYNCVCAPIGLGDTIAAAFDQSECAIKQLNIPDMMWRNDVCKCITKRYNEIQRMGWLKRL